MSELIDRANAEMQPEVNTKSLIRTLPTKTMNELLDRIAELEQDKAELVTTLKDILVELETHKHSAYCQTYESFAEVRDAEAVLERHKP